MTFQENVSLAQHTTLGVGGPARWFVHVASEPELLEAIRFARARRLPIFVLGGGSNLLVSDAGFDGLVLQPEIGKFAVDTPRSESPRFYLEAPAGYNWDKLVERACRAGYTGIECLAGIPGTVGGTPVQNVGAYGQEVSQTISEVRVLDLETLEFRDLSAAECHFAYRSSIFNTTHRGRFIVTYVTFAFDKNATPTLTYADLLKHFAGHPNPTPLQISEAVRAIRRGKGMLLVDDDPDSHSAGSFFKNPIVAQAALVQLATTLSLDPATIPHWPAGDEQIKLPAAWLVERAGFHKGLRMGRAAISTKHTLALVNLGGATAAEIVALRDAVMHEVNARFAIQLEQEPVMLGFTPGLAVGVDVHAQLQAQSPQGPVPRCGLHTA